MKPEHRLFHVSEDGTIQHFLPRHPPSIVNGRTDPCVWAVDEQHLVNYLLPRDCPRVTFYVTADTTVKDAAALGPAGATQVVAIESQWIERAMHTAIWLYTFEAHTFEALDPGAGYFVSSEPVTPIEKRLIPSPLQALVSQRVELRIMEDLWPLRDAVIRSSLQFSCIRMRNARPRSCNLPSSIQLTS